MGDADKLKITIVRDECISDGACCSDAPETFEMDDDNIAILKDPVGGRSGDDPLKPLGTVPVDAIIVEDTETGEKLYPED